MISKQDFKLKLVKVLKSWKKSLSAKVYTTLLWLGLRPTEIYVLTTVSFEKEWGSKRSRCWGWHATLKEAVSCAIHSSDFYSECGYYTHIVIEKAKHASFPFDHTPLWFELRRLEKPIDYTIKCSDGEEYPSRKEYETIAVEAPKQARSIVGWGMG